MKVRLVELINQLVLIIFKLDYGGRGPFTGKDKKKNGGIKKKETLNRNTQTRVNVGVC